MPVNEEPTVEISLTKVFSTVYRVALALAVLMALMAMSKGTDGYAYLMGACFLGIVSRVFQADYHHREALSFRRPLERQV